MQVVLAAGGGTSAERTITLNPGQSLQAGRAPTVEFSFPADLQMSSAHFCVSWDGTECRVEDLNSTNGTFLNGDAIRTAVLRPGDRLRAGGTEFVVRFATPAADPAQAAGPRAEAAASAPTSLRSEPYHPGFISEKAAEIAPLAAFQEGGGEALEESQTPEQFIEMLAQRGLPGDAIRFLAQALPKRDAVWWAARSARSVLGESSDPRALAPLEAAEAWVNDPSEEHRRAAMTAAEAAGFDVPASWAAVGAFWSGGSLGPPEAPVVPPGEDLTGKAVAGAVLLAAVLSEPEKAAEKQRRFIEEGLAIAAGTLSWQKKSVGAV